MRNFLRNIISAVRQENLLILIAVIVVMVLCSSLALTWFEPDVDFISSIWWSIVTLTTVGYGDISPSTAGGRVVAAVIMFFGIGVLGMFSASLATIMISHRMKESKGMIPTDLKKHIILCEWNHRSRSVLRDLRADPKTANTPVVIIADLGEKPVDDPLLVFIAGAVDEESLGRANLQEAATIVVLGDDSLDPTSRDAKVVLTTLTVETINPGVYSIVEIVNEGNRRHCKRANANEIIVGSELSSNLLASAAIDHGMSGIVSEIINTRYGNDLYSVAAGESLLGKDFLEVMTTMKTRFAATVLGIQKGHGGEVRTNPDHDYCIVAGDYLVLLARQRPEL